MTLKESSINVNKKNLETLTQINHNHSNLT